jgi:mannitol/fructose-specific phosphotransferase system IIA component (Ntr-type)
MITIADTLLPDRVLLNLAAKTPEAAVEKLLAALRKDERIVDWEEFAKVVRTHPQCRVADNADFGIVVSHARTDAVSQMAMSAARLAAPLDFPGCPKPIRYIFCFGIPMAMASDYLRIAGALMRIFSDPETESELRAAATREKFVASLGRLELKA